MWENIFMKGQEALHILHAHRSEEFTLTGEWGVVKDQGPLENWK